MSFPLLIAGLVALSLIAAGQFLLARRAKRIERDLREEIHKARLRAEAFQNLMEHAPFEVILKDSEGRYVEVSRSWQEYYGMSGEDAAGKTPREIFGGDFGTGLSARDQRALNEGRPIETEDEAPHSDGTTHLFHTITFPIPGEDGQPASLGMISTDITERKVTERALRETEKRFRAVLDNAPVTIVLKDANERYLLVNRAWENRFGVTNEEAVGKTIVEISEAVAGKPAQVFFRPDVAKIRSVYDRKVLEEGKTLETEEQTPGPAGMDLDFLAIRFPISDREGKVTGLGLVGTEITDRKHTERALRDSEEQLRTITDNLPVLIVRWDREQKYRFANRPAEQWYGLSASEFIGKTILEVFGVRAHETVRWAIEKGLSGEVVRFEQRLEYPDGITRDVEIAYIPEHAEDGEVLGCFALVQDVSERRKLEAELLRKERLAAMGQLTGTVAHELRNPLGAIAVSLGVIGQKAADAELDLGRALERATRGVGRCETIITELLDFARAKGLQPQSTLLDDWLARLLDEYEAPDAIRLSLDLQCAGVEASIDRDKLRRAIINLLENACDAMSPSGNDGEANLELAVSTRVEGGRVKIIVADNGPGIPADIMPAIMEPLFSTKSFGTGLGLPTVKRILEEHGGGIEIESKEGKGVRVKLWLPTDDGPKEAAG